jgi:hypothetical protein
MDFDTKYAEVLDLYTTAAQNLEKNHYEINACRCSNDLAQLLLEVDKWTYWFEFSGCLKNPDKLADFARSKTEDIVAYHRSLAATQQ